LGISKVPFAPVVPESDLKEPSGCGTSAATSGLRRLQSKGLLVEPLSLHSVSIWLMRMVPEGVTVQDCVADAPPDAVAVAVKLFGTRDCCAAGVRERVFPLSVAPAGAFDKENVTAAVLLAVS
jgi:hypothetical protein